MLLKDITGYFISRGRYLFCLRQLKVNEAYHVAAVHLTFVSMQLVTHFFFILFMTCDGFEQKQSLITHII